MSKKTIIIATVFTFITASSLLANKVLAQNSDAPGNHMSDMAQQIANKFGLQQDEVQSVFDDFAAQRQQEMQTQREEHQAQAQQQLSDSLDQAVSDGKITQEQKQLILDKHNQLQEDAQTRMQNQHDELVQWAQDNGIDTDVLQGLMFRTGFRGGPREF